MKITREEILEGIGDVILQDDIEVDEVVELGLRAVELGMIPDDKESILSWLCPTTVLIFRRTMVNGSK